VSFYVCRKVAGLSRRQALDVFSLVEEVAEQVKPCGGFGCRGDAKLWRCCTLFHVVLA